MKKRCFESGYFKRSFTAYKRIYQCFLSVEMEGIKEMKRIVIFTFYDPDGIVDSYIGRLLSGIRPYADMLIAVCNCGINAGREYIAGCADEIIMRENKGYDAGAYKDVIISLIKTRRLSEYDQLVLFNDTIYGFFYPLSELFKVVNAEKKVDFWGMTEHSGIGQYKGINLSWHLQGYFLIINERMLHNSDFFIFWETFAYPETYTEAIFRFEIGMSQYFLEKGYVLKSIYSPERINVPKDNDFGNLYFSHAYELVVRAGCPILKVKSIENLSGLEALGYLEKNKLCDSASIWEHYRRRIRTGRVENDTYNLDALWEFCARHQSVYIYGNGMIGKRIYGCIVEKGYAIAGFLVTKKNDSQKEGDAVYEFSKLQFDESSGIIVGMKREYREEVMNCILSRVDGRHVFVPMS